jgi:hypothetical protein
MKMMTLLVVGIVAFDIKRSCSPVEEEPYVADNK